MLSNWKGNIVAFEDHLMQSDDMAQALAVLIVALCKYDETAAFKFCMCLEKECVGGKPADISLPRDYFAVIHIIAKLNFTDDEHGQEKFAARVIRHTMLCFNK